MIGVVTYLEQLGYERGFADGELKVTLDFTLAVLTQKLGKLEKSVRLQVEALSLVQLTALLLTALSLENKQELLDWLTKIMDSKVRKKFNPKRRGLTLYFATGYPKSATQNQKTKIPGGRRHD